MIHFNTMVKNEEDLLSVVLPIWREYPVDKFVFYDDNSTDNTLGVVSQFLEKDRFVILNDRLERFSESHNRSCMLEYSREDKADFVFSIDADEILSANLLDHWDDVLGAFDTHNLMIYWFNVVEGTTKRMRQDPAYKNNYRSFILPLRHTGAFDLSLWKYHTPRVPPINLPPVITDRIGVIHLQSINTRFYALKQLWYKHHEWVVYNHREEDINQKYDGVVNNLIFNSVDTPEDIIAGIEVDPKIYDAVLEKKGYLDFIHQNYNEKLITFGKEFL